MNQLKCEMCGSTDLVKQDGVFVCQVCGTKYTVEEAKKMMIEGTVDVQGTVKIDISDELAKLYRAARNAKDNDSKDNAIKYYDMILQKDPTSWEAEFYIVYFKALQCKIAEIQSAAISVSDCLKTVLTSIKENVGRREDQVAAVKEVGERCMSISGLLYNAAQNYYNGLSASVKYQYLQQMINSCFATKDIMYLLGDNVELIFGNYEELIPLIISAWTNGIQQHDSLMPHFSNKATNRDTIEQYAAKIQKYDPNYRAPEIKFSRGCYVATCVYGSYDCPQVWTLRRYRDTVLGSTRRGRAFIRCYYAVSPTLVKWFGNTNWFKKLWRGKLDKMVHNLQEQGVENTPYEDIDWRENARLSRKKDRT